MSVRDRGLVTCCVLSAQGKFDELRVHMSRTVENGVTVTVTVTVDGDGDGDGADRASGSRTWRATSSTHANWTHALEELAPIHCRVLHSRLRVPRPRGSAYDHAYERSGMRSRRCPS
jgi:hypothetical protein